MWNRQVPKDPRFHRLHETHQAFRAIPSKKLTKQLEPGVPELLEEGAECVKRVRDLLDSPLWTSPNLGSTWAHARQKTLDAIETSMEDLLMMTRDAIRPKQEEAHWQEVVQVVMVDVFGVEYPKPKDVPLSPAYFPAQEIVNQMQKLVREIEIASTSIGAIEESHQVYPSYRAIEDTLGELKDLQKAEDEFRQNLSE